MGDMVWIIASDGSAEGGNICRFISSCLLQVEGIAKEGTINYLTSLEVSLYSVSS